MDLELEEVVATFLDEAAERLDDAERALVALEAHPEDAEAIATVFRVMHTIKGNAGSLGFPGVAELTHGLEDVLDRLRKGTITATPALVTAVLRSLDVLRRLLGPGAPAEQPLSPEDRLLLRQLRVSAANGADAALPTAVGPAPEPKPEEHTRTLRVDRDKLDRLLNLSGELAIVQGRLRESLAHLDTAVPSEIQDEADHLFTELQETVMQARMIPVGPVFRRCVRTIRDLALASGKQARLVIQGEDVEVDASVVDAIRDPLTHMVRNAVDHGIESPAEREAAGKDPCGVVTVRAAHQAGSIVIQVADDGRGLDRERILARARSLGVASEGRLADLEIDRLVFAPGISTAEKVTEVSGRGVGLDVVRRNVEALRGSVSAEGTPGRGTTITLRLPLTLAIIAGLDVRAGGETFVVPLDAVEECVELPAADAPGFEGSGVMNLRGEVLPFVRLTALLRTAGGTTPRSRQEVVVVRTGNGLAGLAVDEVLGGSQAVIKPLGRVFQGLPGVSGATILGDGRVALILDVTALLRSEGARRGIASSADSRDVGGTMKESSQC